MIVHMYRKWQF